MFKSKYIFETKETRFLRHLKNFFFITLTLFIIYLLLGYFFIQHADREKSKAKEKFYGITPDLITVFTGSSGRIPLGISLAKKYKQSNIFITGVYGRNNLQTLLEPLEINQEINTDLIEIDYYAQNTVENVLSTLRHLRENKALKNILIISHDYHIPRIKTIVDKLKRAEDKYDFYYIGVETSFNKSKDFKTLYKEVYKYLRTYIFLTIWD